MSGQRNHSRSRLAAWAELTGDDVPESIEDGGDGTVGRDGPDRYRVERGRDG
ncbi:MAG: hypothetical protein ABEH81_14765 [Halopenitus sp.]